MMTSNHFHENKPTLIAVGLFIPGTGFTRVFESLLPRLARQYTIHWMGIGYRGPVIDGPYYTVHPVNVSGGDIYGAHGSAAMAIATNAAAILLLNDFFMLKNYERQWRPLKQKNIRLLAYTPIDGYFTDTRLIGHCLAFDHLIFYSGWALKEAGKMIGTYLYHHPGLLPEVTPCLQYIYHGVDTHIFRKETNRLTISDIREKLFKVPGAADAVFILNANRFDERKDIGTTLTAFKKALPHFQKPAYLCLHMPANNEEKKAALFRQLEELDITGHVIYNPLGDSFTGIDQLRSLYQCCQVGINTSLGEGWGLVSFEHAACGGAQVVPGHTTPGELWQGHGIVIGRESSVQLSSNPFLMYRVDEAMLAQSLVQLVNDKAYLEAAGNAAYAFAQEPAFSWETIAAQWMTMMANEVSAWS